MMKTLTLKYDAKCSECGKELPIGTKAIREDLGLRRKSIIVCGDECADALDQYLNELEDAG